MFEADGKIDEACK